MKRTLSLFFVSLAAVATSVAFAAPVRAADSADACVSIQSAALSSGLAMDVKNECDKRLSCALTWTLTCENASGKVTSKAKQGARFDIAASDVHHTTGSASTCKDGWKIEDVAWDCAATASAPARKK